VGGIGTVAAVIGAELLARFPRQNKKQREGLALLIATVLQVRGVNLNEWAAAVPREAERLDMRYQWISRVLGNALIDIDGVMAPFAQEVVARYAQSGRTLVVMIDQSKVNDAHQMIMVSLRGRARLATCLAHEEDAGRDRLWRAEGSAGGGRRPASPRDARDTH
jgi:hypothetical protein